MRHQELEANIESIGNWFCCDDTDTEDMKYIKHDHK